MRGYKMKKIIVSLVICLALFGSIAIATNETKAMSWCEFSTNVKYNKIKIKVDNYEKGNKPKYIKVYRAELSGKQFKKTFKHNYELSIKKFKYIKTVKKLTFTDKNIKKGKYYAYGIKAYNKKHKKISEAFRNMKGGFYTTKVVCKPKIKISEKKYEYIAKKHYNTGSRISIYIKENSKGSSVDYYVIYRREAQSKKYKKLKTIKCRANETLFDDKKVKPNKTYFYKAKAVAKVGKKKYYSPKSSTCEAKTINYFGKYKVGAITEPSDDVKEIIFWIQNNSKGNGEMTLYPLTQTEPEYTYDGEYLPGYCYGYYEFQKNKYSANREHLYHPNFAKYSYDMVNWKNITDSGIDVPKKKKIYIKAVMKLDWTNYYHWFYGKYGYSPDGIKPDEPYEIPFGGNLAYISRINIIGEAEYTNSTSDQGITYGTFDFVTGKGKMSVYESVDSPD